MLGYVKRVLSRGKGGGEEGEEGVGLRFGLGLATI